MNLHMLRVFVSVVDTGSFSRAAQLLDISQPAVSKAVRGLESQLDTVLLERHGRTFRPTEAGDILHGYGRSIFAVEREAHEAINAFYGLERGRLTVGASTTIATYWLPPHVMSFKKRHPGIDLRLISANTSQIVDMLIDCQLDVALVEGPVEDPHVESRPWRREEMVVIAGPGDGDEKMATEPIGEQLWIVREYGSGSREATDELLSQLGKERPRTVEVGANEAVVQAVAAGGGLGFVPRVCASDQIALGRVRTVTLRKEPIERQLYRLHLPHRMSSQAALAFEAIIAETL